MGTTTERVMVQNVLIDLRISGGEFKRIHGWCMVIREILNKYTVMVVSPPCPSGNDWVLTVAWTGEDASGKVRGLAGLIAELAEVAGFVVTWDKLHERTA